MHVDDIITNVNDKVLMPKSRYHKVFMPNYGWWNTQKKATKMHLCF